MTVVRQTQGACIFFLFRHPFPFSSRKEWRYFFNWLYKESFYFCLEERYACSCFLNRCLK